MDNQVYRSFAIRHLLDGNGASTPCLIMYSSIEGEYGPISLTIIAELEKDAPLLSCSFKETSGSSMDVQSSFRITELSYFVRFILPLFNPLTLFHDEVSFPSAPESQNP